MGALLGGAPLVAALLLAPAGYTDEEPMSEGLGLGPGHHPVGRSLPDGHAGFNQPGRRDGRLSYFDTNGNGRPDEDEVRLYGTARLLACGSCHGDPPERGEANAVFLRVENRESRLCLICHRM